MRSGRSRRYSAYRACSSATSRSTDSRGCCRIGRRTCGATSWWWGCASPSHKGYARRPARADRRAGGRGSRRPSRAATWRRGCRRRDPCWSASSGGRFFASTQGVAARASLGVRLDGAPFGAKAGKRRSPFVALVSMAPSLARESGLSSSHSVRVRFVFLFLKPLVVFFALLVHHVVDDVEQFSSIISN